jgi:hypothetical protein
MRCNPTFGLKEVLGAVILSCFIAGGVSAMTDSTTVKAGGTAAISITRTEKGDRLPPASGLQQRPNYSEGIPASTAHVPLGCDAAFSPIADPARSRIFKRCVA